MYLLLPPPDWTAVLGGSDEEARWIADRDRKFGMITEQALAFEDLAQELERRGLLFLATPAVLAELPLAVDWYVSLAGYALNTLNYVRQAPLSHGLNIRARTVRDSLAQRRPVSLEQREALAEWINADLQKLYPAQSRSASLARAVVFGILGGRSLGRSQNVAGDDGVLLLKRLFVSGMEGRGHDIELSAHEQWKPYDEASNLQETTKIRLAGQIVCDFGGGGNRPDVVIRDKGLVIANGEVKARKDISNVWESWMPSIENHLRTWTAETPDAVRLFFGTLVTPDMVDGTTHGGAYRAGLKQWHQNGLLQNSYNLTKAIADDTAAVRTFKQLLDAIEARAAA